MKLLRRAVVGCAIVAVSVLLCLLALHKDGSIRTEVSIDCSPQQAWRILIATNEYPSWNPMISRMTGELREGNVIEFTEGSGSDGMTFHPTILRVHPAQELRAGAAALLGPPS